MKREKGLIVGKSDKEIENRFVGKVSSIVPGVQNALSKDTGVSKPTIGYINPFITINEIIDSEYPVLRTINEPELVRKHFTCIMYNKVSLALYEYALSMANMTATILWGDFDVDFINTFSSIIDESIKEFIHTETYKMVGIYNTIRFNIPVEYFINIISGDLVSSLYTKLVSAIYSTATLHYQSDLTIVINAVEYLGKRMEVERSMPLIYELFGYFLEYDTISKSLGFERL